MNIVLPLENDHVMADDFTKSSFIGIYNTKSGSMELKPVCEQNEDTGALMQILTYKSNYVVISPAFSVMALQVFKRYTVETYKAVGRSVTDNISLFQKKALLPFEIYQQLTANSCGSGCGSCSTSDNCIK